MRGIAQGATAVVGYCSEQVRAPYRPFAELLAALDPRAASGLLADRAGGPHGAEKAAAAVQRRAPACPRLPPLPNSARSRIRRCIIARERWAVRLRRRMRPSPRRAALALFAAVLTATGCSRHVAGPKEPRSTRTLVFAQQWEPHSLNPALENGDSSQEWGLLLFSYLVKYGPDGTLIPDVATAVPTLHNGGISRDGRTITYHLRHDVRFADGSRLTAKDAAWSIDAVNNPRNDDARGDLPSAAAAALRAGPLAAALSHAADRCVEHAPAGARRRAPRTVLERRQLVSQARLTAARATGCGSRCGGCSCRRRYACSPLGRGQKRTCRCRP